MRGDRVPYEGHLELDEEHAAGRQAVVEGGFVVPRGEFRPVAGRARGLS